MTKIISLVNDKQPKLNKKKKLPITITSDGMFFSGSAPYAHDIYTKFTHDAFSVTKATKLVEKEKNIEIDFKLAIQETIPKNSLHILNDNQIIIRDMGEEDFLFTIEDTHPDIIHDIWMDIMTEDETDHYEEIGYFMEFHGNTMITFLENCLCAMHFEHVNGELDQKYIDKVYSSFDTVNAFEIEDYQSYLNRANPKETFDYMGLQL